MSADNTNYHQLEEGSAAMLQFEKRGGLLPVIVQNAADDRILMLGYVNPEALDTARASGYATFFSTSRNSIWIKGETSGDKLEIDEILVDCDQDALVYRVRMCGDGVCHTRRSNGKSRISCFYRRINSVDDSLDFRAESE